MRFLGLVASQGGLFHLPENMFLKKVLQKRLNTKIFISDKPEFCGAIGAGLFAVDSDRLLERLECNALNINPKNLVILNGYKYDFLYSLGVLLISIRVTILI